MLEAAVLLAVLALVFVGYRADQAPLRVRQEPLEVVLQVEAGLLLQAHLAAPAGFQGHRLEAPDLRRLPARDLGLLREHEQAQEAPRLLVPC